MTEDAGQNYLILMETIRIYLFIQIANLGVCVGGGEGPPRSSALLLDLAFSHAWKIMFDPSFLICGVCFNMRMHNLYHSLYHYATSFFFLNNFASLRLCHSFSLVTLSGSRIPDDLVVSVSSREVPYEHKQC